MPGKILSHPHKSLVEHLLNTLAMAERLASENGLELSNTEKVGILLHDLAKAHPKFQKKLKLGYGRFEHSLPSAIFALWLTKDLICAEVIRNHHTNIKSIIIIDKFWSDLEYGEEYEVTLKHLPWWPEAESVCSKINEFLDLEIPTWQSILPEEDLWDDLISFDLDNLSGWDSKENLENDWLRLRKTMSLLVAADRFDAAVGGEFVSKTIVYNKGKLASLLANIPPTPVSQWREKVRNEIIKEARSKINEKGIYTISLPTGAGKTIIGLQIAMEAAERLNSKGIIYVLPFISLVEQNAETARNIFDNIREDHSMVSLTKSSDGYESFIEFFRYWDEPVVVTTLAKLWDVIFSPKVNDSMSFHRLANSILILDEPQSIRSDCWHGFGKMLEFLSNKLNTVILLMTATQPKIAEGIELTSRKIEFPVIRHDYQTWIGDEYFSDISNTIEELINLGLAEKSSLLVLNTRKSALKTWAELKTNNIKSYFLSAWICPKDRKAILEKIKTLEKEGQNRCLVSTQVIEAGIDLDFQLLYRDLGPLDSIVQVGGRCNRHGKLWGNVYIGHLKENGQSYSKQVYDSVQIDQTQEILKKYNSFDERDVRRIIDEYYTNLQSAINNSSLWENIGKGKWGEKVQLYDEYFNDECMVVIDFKGEFEKKLLILFDDEKEPIDKMDVIRKRRDLFKELSFQSIQVPRKYIQEWEDYFGYNIISDCDEEKVPIEQIREDMWLLRKNSLGTIYRKDIGFLPLEIYQLIEEIS